MTYVRRSSTTTNFRTNRVNRYRTSQRAARKKKVATARATVKTNRTMVKKNTLAIKKLKFNQWGTIQSQRSTMLEDVGITSGGPLLFLVNNPLMKQQGPYIWGVQPGNQPAATGHRFQPYQPDNDFMENHAEPLHRPNGSKIMLRYATFQFEFTGFVDATHVRVDFIRQKKTATSWWNPEYRNCFLPMTLPQFKHIAGFGPNEIDRTLFDVIATRRIYMNSKGRSNASDTLQDRITTEATTTGIRHCRVSLKLNKVLKQLTPSMDQGAGGDYEGINENSEGNEDENVDTHPHKSAWSHDNQHPLSNIWCLISTDDGTPFDGDSVRVKILRKLTWQDHIV